MLLADGGTLGIQCEISVIIGTVPSSTVEPLQSGHHWVPAVCPI